MIIRFRTNNRIQSSSIILLSLGLFSFGGGSGRFYYGLGLFDIALVLLILPSLSMLLTRYPKYPSTCLKNLLLLLIIIIWGLTITAIDPHNVKHDFVITELRFFLYLPILYLISITHNINLSTISRCLPSLLITYLIIWSFFLFPGNPIYEFFNNRDLIFKIGDQQRISGPPIAILVPILLMLIRARSLSFLTYVLYIGLTVIIFMKTGNRSHFLYQILPLFYYLYRNRSNTKAFALNSILIISAFFSIIAFASTTFFQRLMNIAEPLQDTSFKYRLLNIEAMLSQLNSIGVIVTGFGIGSDYSVMLYGWRDSFFLDNTFLTIIYKTGIIGILLIIVLFIRLGRYIPPDIYYFQIIGIILIGSVTYHLILNPVFIYGLFLMASHFQNAELKRNNENYLAYLNTRTRFKV